MTAGLFAKHGVFFGECVPPAPMNPKGFFENEWLRRVYNGQVECSDFDKAWKHRLRSEGYSGGVWGAKCGAERWGQYWQSVPDIAAIVLLYRPEADIEKSRERIGWVEGRRSVQFNWGIMNALHETKLPTFAVNTPNLVDGDYSEIIPAFDALGIRFDPSISHKWIDENLFHK